MSFSPEPIIVDHVPEPIDRAEVLRYLGYPAGVVPAPQVAESLERWLRVASELAVPRAIFRILPVESKSRRTLRVVADGIATEFHGAIGEFLGAAAAVGVFIATAGAELERRASELMSGDDPLGAMVLNAVGAERAEAAESVVVAQMRDAVDSAGFAPTLPYSPGYCGMPLVEQRKLFALFDHQAIGVTLTEHCLMIPMKSISGLIGLGPSDQIAADGSPCDRCELHHCAMRR